MSGGDGRAGGTEDGEPVVLGMELWLAGVAEAAHRGGTSGGRSPLAGVRYDRDEVSLSDFAASPRDDLIGRLAGLATTLDPAGRDEVRAALRMEDFYTLLTFAQRSAVRALREGGRAAARAGLDALVLVDASRVDWRDATVAAALVSYALGRADADAAAAFTAASPAAERQMAQIISRFAGEPVTSLGPWGKREIQVAANAALIDDDGEPYAPAADLLSLARAVRSLIRDDGVWQVGETTVGTEISRAWLRGDGEAARGVLGCVSMHGRIAGEVPAGYPDQHLLIYLAEAASAADAGAIALAARPGSDGRFACLPVYAGPLAAIMIARSVRAGVESLEDDSTLGRFASPLSVILTACAPGGSGH